MNAAIVGLAALLAMANVAHAQRSAADTIPLRCDYHQPGAFNHVGTQTLRGGYVARISFKRDEVEEACTASVTTSAGRTVFQASGFAAAIDKATGMDIDGDGSPDLVLYFDTGGGNHCCWKLTVISFAPSPHKLTDVEFESDTHFRTDAQHRVTLWSWEGGLQGTDSFMAGRLFARRVYRWSNGKFADETPAHCAEIKSDTVQYRALVPTGAEIQRLKTFGVHSDSASGIGNQIEMLMLQDVFCRQFDGALQQARTMWPADDRAAFIARYRDMVIRAYPEYTAALQNWR